MAAAVEVVELIGMETQSAISCKVEGNNACGSTSKEKRRSEAGRSLVPVMSRSRSNIVDMTRQPAPSMRGLPRGDRSKPALAPGQRS